MLLFWCSHKFGKVGEDRYQYCEKCGRARFVPIIIPQIKCSHKWVMYQEAEISNNFNGNMSRRIITLQCQKCGDMKDHETGVNS